jgi:hypothetical protein
MGSELSTVYHCKDNEGQHLATFSSLALAEESFKLSFRMLKALVFKNDPITQKIIVRNRLTLDRMGTIEKTFRFTVHDELVDFFHS